MASERAGSVSTPIKGSMAAVGAARRAANVSNVAATPSQRISAQRSNAVVTAPPAPNFGGGNSGGGNAGGGYSGNPADTASAAVSQPDLSVETLTKTPEYLARERAIQAAMGLFNQTQATDTARYNENYNKALRDLGYNANTGFDRGALMSSGQRATTSGRAYNAMGDDFAARGMLQSGAYQAHQGVLGTQLEDQRQAIDQAKLQFGQDQQAKLIAQQNQNEQSRLAALEAARQSILNSMGA